MILTKGFKLLLVLLTCFISVSICEAGLFDASKPAGYGMYELSKPKGELADGMQVMSGLAVELINDIWGFVYIEYGVAGDDRGIAGTGGISANIKKLAEIRDWGYQPHQEINVGLCGGFRVDDECWLAGFYASIGWGRN